MNHQNRLCASEPKYSNGMRRYQDTLKCIRENISISFVAWTASNNACDNISKCHAPHYRAAVKQGFIKDGCQDWSKTVVLILLSRPTGQQWAYVDLVIFLCIIRVTTCRGYDDCIQHCLYNWARLYVVSAGIRTFSTPFRDGRW